MQSHQPVHANKSVNSAPPLKQTKPLSASLSLINETIPLHRLAADSSQPLSPSHIMQLQKAIGNRAVLQLLSTRKQLVQPIQRANISEQAMQLESTASEGVVQRVISGDQFVEDTTSSFLCMSWRKGTMEQRAEIEGLLETFEYAESIVEQIQALRDLTSRARMMKTDSEKFRSALDKILSEGNELLDNLEKSEEWIAYLAEKKVAEQREADEQEQAELAELGNLSWDERVTAFKQKYNAADVVDTLIAGTELLAGSAKLLKLAQNYANIGFVYSMKSVDYKPFLAGRKDGDCSTVSRAMAAIIKEVYLMDATVGSCEGLLVDSNERTIDGAKVPNAENGDIWTFSNHFWVESSNGSFDPLFARAKSVAGWNYYAGEQEVNELKLSIEDYGGDYKIVSLNSADALLHTRITKISRSDWAKHCKFHNLAVTYEDMLVRLG